VRLTYNLAADRRPSWLAEGAGLIYSAQQLDRTDDDVCLALIPPGGGTQRQLWCDVPSGEDMLDAIESAVLSPGGRVGFVSATGSTGAPSPARQDIAVAPSLDPASAQRVRPLPNIPHGAATQTSAEYLRWLDDSRLVYVDQILHVRRPCPPCEADTIRIGKSVTVLDVDAADAAPISLPGTSLATGVAIPPGSGSILYTLAGDSRVYRQGLADGMVDVFHDFGAAGVVRDIHLAGNRLAAVVGGRVAFVTDFQLGPMQWDSGGVLHVLDLESGGDVILGDTPDRLYRRPALSPQGDRLVAEGYPVSPTEGGAIVGRSGDLYLFDAP
jgi:hypothetical protein